MGAFDDLIPQSGQKPAAGGAFSDLIPQKPAQKSDAPSGFVRGLRDPIDGAAQLLTNILPDSLVESGNKLNNWIADKTGLVAKLPESGVDGLLKQQESEYQAARKASGEDGFDWGRLAGNVLSPANAGIAAVAPIRAASLGGKALQGARAGALGAAAAPVTEGDDFATAKAAQVVGGALAGGVLTPVAAKAGETITRRIVGLSPAQASSQADDIMREGVNRLRREGLELSQDQIAGMREQVMQALQQGQKADAAAMFRKADFEALGMKPTLGQITRDPAQYSRERNLQGVSGIGDPLHQRFNEQINRMQELVTGKSAGAADDFNAGEQMMNALRGVDDAMNARVNAAYGKARDHLGRAAPMDSAQFSTKANEALDSEMLGGVLPATARDILNKVTKGEIPFNVNTAVQIDQTLSRMQRGASSAEAYAIGKVRDALNSTSIADNVGDDAKAMFDAARGMARSRFKTHEAVPALKAAADGDISAQDFVRRFLINGKAEEVRNLASVMPEEAKQEARRQFGVMLERAAFGQNTAGDKQFASESFAKLMNQPGMRQKLTAFFTPKEVGELDLIMRVGAYMNNFPANSTVNTSNTAAALANLVTRIPGVPQSLGLLTAAKNAAGNQMAVRSAMAANPATAAADLAPEQVQRISRLLGIGAAGLGGAVGTGVGQ